MNIAASLQSFPYLRFGLTVAIGTSGGAVFAWIGLPLPWMLGAMTAALIASLSAAPVAAPAAARRPMSAIIGVMLGSSFTPQLLATLPTWIIPILGLLLLISASGLLGTLYYKRLAGYDLKTAYFSAMPGGLAEMLLLGEHYGADTRRIALVHGSRIFLVVMTLPFLVEWISGESLAASATRPSTPLEITAAMWLAATAIGGVVLGRLFRLPAYFLLGPMLISMAIHALGLSDFQPPLLLVNAAQVVVGTTVGCQFIGVAPRAVAKVLALSVGYVGILLSLTLIAAGTVSILTSQSIVALLLAYAAGGVAETGLIAMTLGIEVTMVTAHHVMRIVVISAGASFGASRSSFGRDRAT